jgi:hypothetical protein
MTDDRKNRFDRWDKGPADKSIADDAARLGIEEWRLTMARAVGDDLVRSVVEDNRGSRAPSSPAEPVKRGTGWSDPVPLKPQPGIDIIDAMVDQQDALDKAELEARLRRLSGK